VANETANEVDRESVVREAAALSELVLWITQARELIEEIQGFANDGGGALSAALEAHDISYNTPDWWQTGAGNGFTYLLHRQNELITSLVQPRSPQLGQRQTPAEPKSSPTTA
jgi:hypothetical protein